MYEFQRRRGRLLTASSLALAAILTAGTGTGWAAGNTTISDGDIVSGGDSSTAITIKDAPGTKASVNLGGDTTTYVLGANGAVDEIEVDGSGHTLTIDGDGGNLVENIDTKSAINLAIGLGTTVEVTGQGGTVGDIIGKGAGATFVVSGGGVSGGTGKGITGLFDLSVSAFEEWINGDMGIGTNTLVYLAGPYDNQRTQAYAQAFAVSVLGDIGVDTTGGWPNRNSFNWTNSNLYHGLGNSDLYSGLAKQEITSVLALSTSTRIESAVTSGTGFDRHYLIDGSLNNAGLASALVQPSGTQSEAAVFAADSLLVVDAARLNGAAALTVDSNHGNRTAVIDQDASLYIVNARLDTTILNGFNSIENEIGSGPIGWQENARADSRLINLRGHLDVNQTAAGAVTVNDAAYVGAGAAYADGRISSGTANMINGLYWASENDAESSNAGIKFVSRAVNDRYLDTGQNNGKQVVTTLEGAAAMAATAGVQSSTYSIANTLASNYNARLSYLNDVAGPAGSDEPGTIGLWINPFYNSTNVDGVSIGRHNAEYDFNYGGGTIGLDSNINENFRLGLAFSAGGGDTESKGHNFNKTDSDFNFWGLGVYGSYTNGMFGLTGDISYSGVSYDIDQRLPSSMGMNKLTADVDTDTFTVGLTGEYRYITESNLNIIPHLGLRYLNLKTDSYRVKEKGVGNVFSIGSETQNIWTIPLGVTFTGDINTNNGWVIQPKADLGVIFATGDLDADSRFKINGTGFGGRLTADDVVDNVTFNGLIGLKAENCDGFSLGLDYNFKASDNLTSHGVTGTIRYDF